MKKLLILLLLAITITSMAQKSKITLETGSLESIKDEKSFYLKYDYEDLTVNGMKENDYIEENVKKKGKSWKDEWLNDRKNKYQPQFEEKINKHLKEVGVSVGTYKTDSKYTMIIKTTMIEPGWNVFATSKCASINAEVKIIETSKPKKIIAIITVMNIYSSTLYVFEDGKRIASAYEICGKKLAKFLIENGLRK